MKIIVSVTSFKVALITAFDIDCHVLQLFGDGFKNHADLNFGTTKYQQDFSIGVILSKDSSFRDTIRFNNLGMAKLLLFLKTLSDQPIVITIEDETIRCEQFVIDFI